MTNLRESSLTYESNETKNITELAKVSTILELEERTFNEGKLDKDGKSIQFSIKVVIVDGEEYRVPDSVRKQLKVHLEEKPDLEFFKVKSTGTGMNTAYTVIPM